MTEVGRAARLRVQRRLAVARHGVEMLERKQRIVAAEHERLLLRADDLRAPWEEAARAAALWADRASALEGWRAIDAAAPARVARVRVEAANVMGVEFPDDGEVDLAARRRTGGGSSLAHAAAAMATAVETALEYAAVRRAAAVVEAELVATRTRRRAVEHRWVPRLEADLARIDAALEELEREENLRVRWAVRAQRGTRDERAPEGVST